jgi:hypothetical protein
MTATATRSKQSKSAPFPATSRPGHSVPLSGSVASLTAASLKQQEPLSDWDHAS